MLRDYMEEMQDPAQRAVSESRRVPSFARGAKFGASSAVEAFDTKQYSPAVRCAAVVHRSKRPLAARVGERAQNMVDHFDLAENAFRQAESRQYRIVDAYREVPMQQLLYPQD